RPVDCELPPVLSESEWILLRDGVDREAQLERLVDALDADLEWRDQHTRIADRAREWPSGDRDGAFLLRGADLTAAEAWLADQGEQRQGATHDQVEYILASRRAA